MRGAYHGWSDLSTEGSSPKAGLSEHAREENFSAASIDTAMSVVVKCAAFPLQKLPYCTGFVRPLGGALSSLSAQEQGNGRSLAPNGGELAMTLKTVAPSRLVVSYGVAILSVLFALALRVLAWPIFQAEAPFLFFVAAVVLSAWYGGLGPGLLATFLSSLATEYYLLPPFQQLQHLQLSHLIWICTFSGIGAFVSYLMENLHIARHRSEEIGRTAVLRVAESEKARKRQDEFLAMLSHELRNPLYAILNAATILKSNNPSEQIAQRAGRVIERQIDHTSRLLDSLLDTSRFMHGKIDLQLERVDLNTIIIVSVDSCRPLIESRRQTLTVATASEPLPVDADPVRLEQVFTNLLNNAAKFTTIGGHIWITAAREGNEAIVLVRDNGIGIAPELLPDIFDIFVQGKRSSDRSEGGLGVGLTLVRALVALHHGKIEAHSDGVGQGSQFLIRLPLFERQELAVPTAEGPLKMASGLKILLVEDSVDSAELVGFLLSADGHTVKLAHDGESGIAIAAEFVPQIILLDIGLPGMDGYEVAEHLRRDPVLSKIPLIALTGYGRDTDRNRSTQAGFCRHLTKPVDLDKLRQALTECV
jgi:signal transduction histidine kinase